MAVNSFENHDYSIYEKLKNEVLLAVVESELDEEDVSELLNRLMSWSV